MRNGINDSLLEAKAVYQEMFADNILQEKLVDLAQLCLKSLQGGGKVIFAGNGGSFADAQHLAAEFVSRLRFDRLPLPSVALGTNSSIMSAIGNDYGYDKVFVREIIALGKPGDVFIPITTSGNSANILSAVEAAKKSGIHVVGMTGKSGGEMISACECLQVPAGRTERIQEGHILLGHILCALVEAAYFAK